ncbi:MAG: 50S ribosomal protein L10 [Thermodesulfobacteriota bacterium]
MKLDKKKEIVEELHDKFSRSRIVILTDYKGLDVISINSLRRQLREAEVEFKVVKNTLLTRACEGTEAELIKDNFVGPTAVAISYEDPVAPAKVLTDFAKDNQKLEIKSAVLRGKVLGFDSVKALASLPSRDVLLGQVLSAMNGVPTSFVRVLSAVPQQFLNVLTAIKDQKEQEAA